MKHTVALPGSMIWMGIRLSSGSRPQSPKGPSAALTQSVFCSYGPVVVERPEMLCAWSSQYLHRPIPPDQSPSVYLRGPGRLNRRSQNYHDWPAGRPRRMGLGRIISTTVAQTYGLFRNHDTDFP